MDVELRILHMNVNGIRLRKLEVQQYLTEKKPSVVLLNETKLSGKPMPRFSGYKTAALRDRTINQLQGGGVAILIASDFMCNDVSPDSDDIAAVEIYADTVKYVIISYYCRPDGRSLDAPLLEQFINRNDRVIIAGDLNAKHQYFGSSCTDRRGEELLEFVNNNDLIVVNDPDQMTRHDTASGHSDLIDYVIMTKLAAAKCIDCYVGEDIGSDHFPLHATIQLSRHINSAPIKLVRPLTKCNWKLFQDELTISFSRLHSSCAPHSAMDGHGAVRACAVDERAMEVSEAITHALNVACPKQLVKTHVFRLSAQTMTLIRLKRKLRRKLQRSNDDFHRLLYNNARRQVTIAMTTERQRAWEAATAKLNNNDGRTFWRTFQTLTGTARHSNRTNVRLTDTNGNVTSETQRVADMFAASLQLIHNTHEGPEFCSATRTEVETYIRNSPDRYQPIFTPRSEDGDEDATVEPIYPEEVIFALQTCRNNSAPGEDEITYSVLKKVPQCVLSTLADFYTVCLDAGYFPKPWKAAIGVMLPKPGKDPKIVTNYRPISLLSTIGKLFEKIISRRMTAHFESTKLL
jgi:exonuclease III